MIPRLGHDDLSKIKSYKRFDPDLAQPKFAQLIMFSLFCIRFVLLDELIEFN